MLDEGYVKFKCHHNTLEWNNPSLPLSKELKTKLNALDELRTELYDAHFIGLYETGIGYGNISLRSDISTENSSDNTNTSDDTNTSDNTNTSDDTLSNNFIISATSTGGARELGLNGYCLVSKLDIDANTVWSTGPLPASSETMTHAAIYQSSQAINCVVHIHNRDFYDALLKQENSLKTPKYVPYGTVEMACAIMDITKKYPLEACIVMAGHDEGVLFYGISINHVRSQIAFMNDQLVHVACNKCKNK